MKALFLFLMFMLTNSLFASDYQMVHTTKKPTHVENPIMVLDNNQPPYIHLKPSKELWITFPREVTRCGNDSGKFSITKLDGNGNVKEDGPVKMIRVVAEAKKLGELKRIMDLAGGGSIYELEDDNINCIFPDGDLKFFKVLISDKPHFIVKFIDKDQDPSKFDAFRADDSDTALPGSIEEVSDGIELIPNYIEYEEKENAPIMIRHIDDDGRSINELPLEDLDNQLPAEQDSSPSPKPNGQEVMISENGEKR